MYIPGAWTLRKLFWPDKPWPQPKADIESVEPAVTTGSARWRCLNIGCGNDYIASTPQKEWVNTDLVTTVKADMYFDAFEVPLPLPDASFDYVKAYDFLEHIPHTVFDAKRQPVRGDGFIVIMDEFWRILKPGGVLDTRSPAYGDITNHVDPTHTRQVLEDTFRYYFVKGGPYSFYTTKHWELVAFDTSLKNNHYARLRKPRA